MKNIYRKTNKVGVIMNSIIIFAFLDSFQNKKHIPGVTIIVGADVMLIDNLEVY